MVRGLNENSSTQVVNYALGRQTLKYKMRVFSLGCGSSMVDIALRKEPIVLLS